MAYSPPRARAEGRGGAGLERSGSLAPKPGSTTAQRWCRLTEQRRQGCDGFPAEAGCGRGVAWRGLAQRLPARREIGQRTIFGYPADDIAEFVESVRRSSVR